MPIIPALGRQRQEDLKFESSLDYIARSCLKKITKNKNRKIKVPNIKLLSNLKVIINHSSSSPNPGGLI
jgi:hypothetical protein